MIFFLSEVFRLFLVPFPLCFFFVSLLPLLPTDGRPMSQANPLAALWETRKALYAHFSDVTVRNDTTIDACVQQIEEALL